MANIILHPSWHIPEGKATSEKDYVNRREFLRRVAVAGAGMAALGMIGPMAGCANAQESQPQLSIAEQVDEILADYKDLPHTRIDSFDPGRAVTSPKISTRYNNAYEFTTTKERVWKLAQDFTMQPWEVEVAGLCEKQGRFDYTELVDMQNLEERVYRFRCVEAWAMTVPWVGMPFRKFVEWAQPKDSVTHVRFVSVMRPEEMEGQRKQSWYPWPYYEALRMDEAMNDLALLVVGMYGKELTPQNGGPLRMIVPWKYGYKSPKYIKRIEFVSDQPGTFWNDLQPKEYSFLSNVNPNVPHPRWSQATERLIGVDERVDTLMYNGYGEQVGNLYT